MNRLVIGMQLVVRVIDYNRVQQRNQGLCGPVTLMHDFVQREPASYVRFVINMAEKGRGSLMLLGATSPKIIKVDDNANFLAYTVTREPPSTTRPTGKISVVEADYLALCSLRYSVIGLPYRPGLDQDGTTPGEMVTWMQEMGYSNVEDHTLNSLWGVAKSQDVKPKFMKHLILAQNKIAGHEVILLCAAGKLTEHQLEGQAKVYFETNKVWSRVTSFQFEELAKASWGGLKNVAMTWFGGHWMHCRKIDIDPDTGVSFALDSWGQSSQLGDYWLPWSKVTSWYRGYLSAKA
jgi:hypothetical protein